MNIVSEILRGISLARWGADFGGRVAVTGFLLAQGLGWGEALRALALPTGLLLLVEISFSWFDPRLRRLKVLAPSAFPFKKLNSRDRDFIQGYFIQLPSRSRHRAALAWGLVSLCFIVPQRILSPDLEPMIAWLALGTPASMLWQSMQAAVLRRKIAAIFYYETDAAEALSSHWLTLAQQWRFFFFQFSILALALPLAMQGLGYSSSFPALGWQLFCVLCFVFAAGSRMRQLYTPALTDLDLAMRRFGMGDYDALVEVSSGDEIGYLQSSWNQALPAASARQARLENFGFLFPEKRAAQLLASRSAMSPHAVEICIVKAEFESEGPLEMSLGTANRFLEAVAESADKALAALDIRNGNRAFVYFNTPVSQEQADEKCLACAWELKEALAVLASIQKIQTGTVSVSRVAVHRAKVMAGRVGPPGRGIFGLVGPDLKQVEDVHLEAGLVVSDGFKKGLKTDGKYCFEPIQKGWLQVVTGPEASSVENRPSALPFTPGERL